MRVLTLTCHITDEGYRLNPFYREASQPILDGELRGEGPYAVDPPPGSGLADAAATTLEAELW
jgi:hypothetical protein